MLTQGNEQNELNALKGLLILAKGSPSSSPNDEDKENEVLVQTNPLLEHNYSLSSYQTDAVAASTATEKVASTATEDNDSNSKLVASTTKKPRRSQNKNKKGEVKNDSVDLPVVKKKTSGKDQAVVKKKLIGADQTVVKEKSSGADQAVKKKSSASKRKTVVKKEKLYCICNKPYDNRFMIECSKCKEWYHGSCMNLTPEAGAELDDKNEDWFCPRCKGT